MLEWRVYQEPFVRGLDSLSFALVRATTYEHHQSRDEHEVAGIANIHLRLVLTFYITIRILYVA